jgi:tetratricopeptide (TPR) repeat protein
MYKISALINRPLQVLLLISLPWVFADLSGQKVVVTEESRPFVTYPFSDPNPVPAMALSSMVSPFYPYFVFDGYTEKPEVKMWKVITLENDFISVTILPEVGGKVWGAVEKSTGKEFIYRNEVMKFRAIGIRGPWTSGGIEHNFGLDLGHAPWTSSPVDYIIKEDTDGSVSCVVGGLDLASRTQWRVTIRLQKDKAFFETNGLWYNPRPLHDAYLSWENAGFSATDDLQFFFPGTYYIGHDGAVDNWPFDKDGRNLSFYRENNFGTSKSYHVSGLFTDWFGGYWHNSGFGFGHWAPYSDAPGKKIWIWSLARDGAIWENLLTDNDGQYIEAQSGVKFNQASHESGFNSPFDQLSIRPYYTETKSESWFPVIATGGMTDASPYGTLNVETTDDSLRVLISPNIFLNDSLIIRNNGKILHSSCPDLKPTKLFTRSIALDRREIGDLNVSLGKNLLEYSTGVEKMLTERPARSRENGDPDSAEHLFLLAEDMYAMREFAKALNYYLKCIGKEPSHMRALYKAAEAEFRMCRYQRAEAFAKKILEKNTYDPGGNFILGLINRRLGKIDQAEEAFSIASRIMEFRTGSYIQIAEARLLKGDFAGASVFAQKALDYNRISVPAHEILIISCRKLNKQSESERNIEELLAIDPLNHFARFEKYLFNPSSASLNDFKSLIRNEFPHETYLEIAADYANRGLYEEAARVLEESPSNPIVLFWLAWLKKDTDNDQSMQLLRKAISLSPFLVFPSRHETIGVLEWALKKNEHWKTRYYLGLVYWHIKRPEKALELFNECGNAPDYAPFYIARGILSQSADGNNVPKGNDFAKALEMDPSEWRTWHFVAEKLQSEMLYDDQFIKTKQAYLRFPANPVVGIDYAKALINNGKYSECLKILERITILPQEGAHEGHDLYELANLSLTVNLIEQGKFDQAIKHIDASKKWPENLGAGKPYEPDIRFQDYLSAFCHRMTGKDDISKEYFNRILEYSHKNWKGGGDPVNIYISNMIFEKAGKLDLAVRAMDKWKNDQDSLRIWNISPGSQSPKVKWIIAKLNGCKEESDRLENEISSAPAEARFRLFLRSADIINSKKNYSLNH